MECKEMKVVLEKYMKEDYESFVKALISLEQGIEDELYLSRLYKSYMENDTITLLNDAFYELVEK